MKQEFAIPKMLGIQPKSKQNPEPWNCKDRKVGKVVKQGKYKGCKIINDNFSTSTERKRHCIVEYLNTTVKIEFDKCITE